MPTIPTVSPSVPGMSNGAPGGISPMLRSAPSIAPVRANPGMYDGKAQAAQNLARGAMALGEGIGKAGLADAEERREKEEKRQELERRVKVASDGGHQVRTQSLMEGDEIAFEAWAKTNPDTATWGKELDARIGSRKAEVIAGMGTLLPETQERLKAQVFAWETNFREKVRLKSVTQDLSTATASYNEFVQSAAERNDFPAIEVAVADAVEKGIFSAATGQNVLQVQARNIQSRQANQLIAEDPFVAEKMLKQVDADGNYVHFRALSGATRGTLMQNRLRGAQAQARKNAMVSWGAQIEKARQGTETMPDEAGIRAEAEEMGIPSKTIDALFKPAKFDPKKYAQMLRDLNAYDLTADVNLERQAELMEEIQGFPAGAKAQLLKLYDDKAKQVSPLNSPVAKYGSDTIRDMFNHEAFGEFKDGPGFEDPKRKMAAQLRMTRAFDAWNEFVRKNPNATYRQAQETINAIIAEEAANVGARTLVDGLFSPSTKQPAKK